MPTKTGRAPLRTRVYIDGYNFYYGCLKGTRFKWLDVLGLFEQRVLPSVQAHRGGRGIESQLLPLAIKYFTASILEQAAKASDSVSSQSRYHSALLKHHRGRVEIIPGYYSITQAKARIVDAASPKRWPRECQEVLVWKLEEKQTDVNLALQLYHDVLTRQVDHVVVVTNDTDIAPALRMVRQHCDAIVGLVVPTRDRVRVPNTELADQADWVRRHVTDDELANSQLPRVIGGRKPTVKPISWYANHDQLERIISLASPLLGGIGDVFRWLERKNPHLNALSPLELIESGDSAALVGHIQKYLAHAANDGCD